MVLLHEAQALPLSLCQCSRVLPSCAWPSVTHLAFLYLVRRGKMLNLEVACFFFFSSHSLLIKTFMYHMITKLVWNVIFFFIFSFFWFFWTQGFSV